MAISLNTLGSAFTLGARILNLFTPPANPITLGNFKFQQFEVPQQIEGFGVKYRLTEHLLPGGKKGVDGMGAVYDKPTWKGTILSQDAAQRVRTLGQMCAAGNMIKLTFGSFNCNVVIEEFTPIYRREGWFDYSITVCVINVLPPPMKPQSLFDKLTGWVGNALGINIPATLAPVTAALGQVSSALQAIQPVLGSVIGLTGGSSVALGLLSGVSQAQSITSGLSGIANGQIGSLTSSLGALTGSSSFTAGLNNITSAIGSTTATGGLTSGISTLTSTIGSSVTSTASLFGAGTSSIASGLTALSTAATNAATLNQVGSYLGAIKTNLTTPGT
jgi:hypothetical protein